MPLTATRPVGLDARAALVVLVSAVVIVFAAGVAVAAVVMLVLAGETILRARTNAARRTLAFALGAFALGALVNLLFVRSGVALWHVPVLGRSVTDDGVRDAIRFGCRMANLVLLGALALRQVDLLEWVEAVTAILAPSARVFGSRVHTATFRLRLAVAFIPGFRTEAERIVRAQRRRGLRLDGPPWRRVRMLLPLFVPVWVGALVQASRTGVVLSARGIRPDRPLRAEVGPWRRRDTATVLAALIGTLGVIGWG